MKQVEEIPPFSHRLNWPKSLYIKLKGKKIKDPCLVSCFRALKKFAQSKPIIQLAVVKGSYPTTKNQEQSPQLQEDLVKNYGLLYHMLSTGHESHQLSSHSYALCNQNFQLLLYIYVIKLLAIRMYW